MHSPSGFESRYKNPLGRASDVSHSSIRHAPRRSTLGAPQRSDTAGPRASVGPVRREPCTVTARLRATGCDDVASAHTRAKYS